MKKKISITRKAFTLLETMVVIIIIGVFALIALPRYNTTVEKFRAKEGEQILITLLASLRRYQLEKGADPANIPALDVDIRPSSYFATVPPDMDITPASAFAQAYIRRKNEAVILYTLTINVDGSFTCVAPLGNICSKMGY